MQIIDAFWEEFNLGLKSCEIIFEKGERIRSYNTNSFEDTYKYIVAKVPVGELNLIHELEDAGFKFIEDQFVISINPVDYKYNKPKFNKRFNDITYTLVSCNEDFEMIRSNIEKGMFMYDRISMDPFFTRAESLKRIQNWIRSLFTNKQAEIYLLRKSNHPAGFFVVEYCDHNCAAITFAGLFNSYINTGIAYFLVLFALQVAIVKGINKVIAVFSSNNRKMFNIISRVICFKVDKNYIVLRKIV